MNKKFLIAWVVIFIAWMAGSFLVHGVLLHADYAKLPNLFRPEAEAQKLLPLMLLAHVIMAGAFVWIYSRGVEAKPWVARRCSRHRSRRDRRVHLPALNFIATGGSSSRERS